MKNFEEETLSTAALNANKKYAEALIKKGLLIANQGYELHRENDKAFIEATKEKIDFFNMAIAQTNKGRKA